jgi:hypothetical protein
MVVDVRNHVKELQTPRDLRLRSHGMYRLDIGCARPGNGSEL